MLGVSYGQLLLLIGAVVAFTGPKDFPRVSRIAGRMAGRAIGYVQLARGQFDVIMHQSQAQQVHKELKDTMAQLEAIRHEIRTVSFMNPGQLTTRLVDNLDQTTAANRSIESEKVTEENISRTTTPKADYLQDSRLTAPSSFQIHSKATASSSFDIHSKATASSSFDIHSKATAYASLAESSAFNSGSGTNEISDKSGLLFVLPVSAESAGLLPNRKGNVSGSDLVLEAIVEAEVANNAKEFFAQPQSQLKPE
ncbi:sec-independent protein translocase protein TatB [Heracleum sosnowskyi]|uniref:Sec-independent protein translocase protein TatB n=1 Tax=Heracleum sosnowskyi TaxID=360622 RepID=A0AAD8MNL1_9APIA|nr:sec-independent protein translocase protein TatB [Heracleum sosnowskyi]